MPKILNRVGTIFNIIDMGKYNVYFQKKGGGSRNGNVIDASSEMEAIRKWKETTTGGKSGENEVIEVVKIL